MNPAFEDLRREVRNSCLVHGQLDAPQLEAPIDCTIWDITQRGARLILASEAAIPDRVSIITPFSIEAREAEVCWRAAVEIGVKFLPGRASNPDAQIAALERRNSELLEQLLTLQKQLQTAEARNASVPSEVRSVEHQSGGGKRPFSYILDNVSRILVTDDDPILREFARVHLATPNASVEVAENGEEGLALLRKGHFDLALVDLEMPGMGGLEMLRELRSDPEFRELPVVVVTSRDDMKAIDLAYEAGATSFVTKPVNWRLMSYQLRYVVRAERSVSQRYREAPLAN